MNKYNKLGFLFNLIQFVALGAQVSTLGTPHSYTFMVISLLMVIPAFYFHGKGRYYVAPQEEDVNRNDMGDVNRNDFDV